jgi:catechol 2,3-dioxygenase-like lactoylglutathione lyase family enzyme
MNIADLEAPQGEDASLPLVDSLHHVSFVVPDLEPARQFYQDILGLRLKVPGRPDFGVPGLWLTAGAVEVHLIVPKPGTTGMGEAPAAPSGIANHVAFRVRDYDQTLQRLRAHGLEVVEGHYGLRQMWVQDPGGNVIEFLEA